MTANLLIPIAGDAKRFKDAGYHVPKPLIMADNQHLLDLSLSSLDLRDTNLIFCVRKEHVQSFNIDVILRNKYGDDIKIIVVDKLTRGTLCTCLLAKDLINNNDPLYIYTPDVYFLPMLVLDNIQSDGFLLTFKANSPAHSYIRLNASGNVAEVAEKQVIGEWANVGFYGFKRGKDFVQYAEEMITNNMTVNNEYYVAPIYNLMIRDGMTISWGSVDKMHVLGTPEDLIFYNQYCTKRFGHKPIAICSDHSGFDTKELIKAVGIQNRKLTFIDFGTYSKQDCDQSDFLDPAIKHVKDGFCDFVIAVCKTGQGMNIAANKHHGIRSALIVNEIMAEYAIRHNAANVFCIPSIYVNNKYIIESILDILMMATFDGGRHLTRIRKFEDV